MQIRLNRPARVIFRWLPARAGALLACASLAACATSTATHVPSPPVELVGCNSGAQSAAETPLGVRMPIGPPLQRYIRGRIVVRFSHAGLEPEIAPALIKIHALQSAPVSELGYASYSSPQEEDPVAAAAALASVPGIADARPIEARYTQSLIVPNDVDFGLASQLTVGPQLTPVQWDMYEIQMPAAWNITTGSPSVRVAIIDTGYDANNIDVCAKVVGSAVFDLGGGAHDTATSAQDMNGHGTNVSAIAASVTNNITRYAGVGWNIQLLEVRVFPQPVPGNPNPGASNFDVAAGINWAVANDAQVINLSLGAPGTCDPTESAAITNAVNAGVTVFVASGNTVPVGATKIDAPANCPSSFAVGASAIDDTTNPAHPVEKIAHYSNYGTGLAMVAPGGDPDAAQATCTHGTCDYLQWITNNYSTTALKFPGTGILIAGTSQATPHVAGVAALMLSKHPGLPPSQIRFILTTSSDDICSGCVQEGSGRLDALTALNNTP